MNFPSSLRLLPVLSFLLLTGCSSPTPPKWDDIRVADYDQELSHYGFNAHPIDQILPQIKSNAVVPGAVIFKSQDALEFKGRIYLAKGSLLAARHPFPHSPYYTVYAIQPFDRDEWIPACGVIAWPRPPHALSNNNTWLSMISAPQP